LEQGKSAVFFSATLHPLPYYCELLGGNATDYLLNVPSIFDQNHFKIAIDRSVRQIIGNETITIFRLRKK
jgi:Rad3-related DNA helicase